MPRPARGGGEEEREEGGEMDIVLAGDRVCG